MTIETRQFVEPSDVKGVEFECRKCGARLLMSLEGIDSVPTSCGRCQENWLIHSSEAHGHLHHFVQRLKAFAKANKEPYVLRFEIRGQDERTGKA